MIYMEQNFNESYWKQKSCPKYDCKKENCKCGLKKVFLASALGDDSEKSPIAPKNGAYCNAIVVYEANNDVYIYSSEGIPTLVEAGSSNIQRTIKNLEDGLAKEILDRQAGDKTLQDEIDEIKNSPDVVDIVATYADLQAYDTSKLGDNDIIRVLTDETHDGQSTYYRWNATTSSWTYIGAVGDYYTKGQVDALLGNKQNKLTAGANVTISGDTISATDTTYTAGSGIDITGNVISATGGTGSATWGGITGTLSDQTDLQNALNAKQDALTAGNAIDITGNVISADVYPADYFTAQEGVSNSGRNITLDGTMETKLSEVQLRGDTTQQTYVGYQLLQEDGLATPSSNTDFWNSLTNLTTTPLGNGWVTFTSTSSVAAKNFSTKRDGSFAWKASTTYTVILEIKNAPNAGSVILTQPQNAGDPFETTSENGQVDYAFDGTDHIVVFSGVTKSTVGTAGMRPFLNSAFAEDSSVDLRMTIVAGNHVSDYQNYIYEPYVGGIASPNPDYPQNVNVVTGEQFITISDGEANNSYTVDLGSIELCKIGTYQDYIYKGLDGWYVHKAIDKSMLGDLSWYTAGTNQSGVYRMTTASLQNQILPTSSASEVSLTVCTHFTAVTANNTYACVTGMAVSTAGSLQPYDPAYNTSTSATAFTTWLQNNNVKLYYVLATPTETKINDADLVAQLNELANATSYDGQTVISVAAISPNLPAILGVTAFRKSLDGTIGAINANTYSDFMGTDGNDAGVAGLVPAPYADDVDKFLKSDGTWGTVSAGPTVVQTTGTSQTDVMSQDATTSMIYNDPATKTEIAIGFSAKAKGTNGISIGAGAGSGPTNSSTSNNIAIGNSALCETINTYDCITIGQLAKTQSHSSISIGRGATVSSGYQGSIAFGAYSTVTRKGEINVGTSWNATGFNNTAYRVIGGVHDGQNNHDCATVAQGNTLSASAPTTSTEGVLGQLWTDTTNMHTYQCTAISGSTYTWTQRW